MESKLDRLREELLQDLCVLQEGIEENLKSIKNEMVKDTLLKIIERQDRLFEYYVGTREEIVKAARKEPKQTTEKNAYTECMDLLFR
jgi:hypothetical protein